MSEELIDFVGLDKADIELENETMVNGTVLIAIIKPNLL